jgi:hypothetical protein
MATVPSGCDAFVMKHSVHDWHDEGKLLDIEMLVCTVGGKERTEKEFAALFNAAGFELARIVPAQSPVCVIEGVCKR